MRNLWLMARHEYRNRVQTRAFVLATLGMPVLIIAIFAISAFVSMRGQSDLPIGYVDHAGFLDYDLYAQLEDAENRLELREFADDAGARSALEAEEIQGYYVVPAGYPQNMEVEVYFLEDWPNGSDFADFLRANLLAHTDVPAGDWWLEGANVAIRAADTGREVSTDSAINIILPLVAAFFFFFSVMGSAGYLLQVVADEKENRTMEILITSISPLQLIAGKALGLMAVALTQIALWLVAVVIGLLIASRYVEFLQGATVPWSYLLIIALYFLPAYALMAAIMTAIGSAVTELQQGQQISGILNMLFIAPVFFVVLIFNSPNSPLLIFLTLFPTTSFLTVAMRWGTTGVPLWQMVASWLILVGTAAFTIWAASRIFRAGMLRYGQRLDVREMMGALRGETG